MRDFTVFVNKKAKLQTIHVLRQHFLALKQPQPRMLRKKDQCKIKTYNLSLS